MKLRFSGTAIASILLTSTVAIFVHAQPVTAPQNLVSNGNFEADANGDGKPDIWGTNDNMTWESEAANHYLRLKSPEPGKLVLNYRIIDIPVGTAALELSWKQRITGLKPGKQAWFDARIMMDFKNAGGEKIKGAPGAPYARKDTDGWVDRTIKFLVPADAKQLEFMPSLFQVETGTFEIDDIVLKPTDSASLDAAAKERAAADALKATGAAAGRQANAEKNLAANGDLFPDGGFQLDADADGVPDKWGALKGALSWQTEGENRFLRITAPEPDKLNLYYRVIDVPATAKAVELKWKQHITGLKPGKQAWFDARIMMKWKNAAGEEVKGAPGAPYARKDTAGWVDKSIQFLVPEGAVQLEFMPCLFQVQTGTYDLDDLSLKPIDPAPVLALKAKADEEAKFINVPAEAANPAKWPSELHVVGNKVLDKNNKEVMLRGVNVDSLEWTPTGERVLRTLLTAVDGWKSNIIRLPVKEEYWFGRLGQTDGGKAYRELVDNAVMLAANRGAYLMLDLHRFRAPTAAHAEFWKDAAARYKNNPAVIFDLFNEPHGISWEVWQKGGFVEDKNAPADEDAFLTPEEKALNAKGFHSVGMQALVDAARGTGAKNVIVVGGLDWAYDLSGIAKGFTLDDKGGNGIILATHIYAGKRDWQNKVLCVVDKYPIIVSEFGANTKKFSFIPAEAQEDAVTWVPKIFGFIDKYKLHYTAFSFHPGSGPQMITGWDYTPTPEWGAFAKRSLAGEKFPDKGMR